MKKNISICSDFRIPIVSLSTFVAEENSITEHETSPRHLLLCGCPVAGGWSRAFYLEEKTIANFSNFISQPLWHRKSLLRQAAPPRAYARMLKQCLSKDPILLLLQQSERSARKYICIKAGAWRFSSASA